MTKTDIEKALETLETMTADLDADCQEPGCPDCEQWRPIWAVMESLRDALSRDKAYATYSSALSNHRQFTHAENCWSWGPAHYECACTEIAKLNGWKK
jgi:hypothetical protein